MAGVRRWSDSDLEEAVASSFSKKEVLERLGLKPLGGNYRTLDKHLLRLGLGTDHFTPHAAAQRTRKAEGYYFKRFPLEDILIVDSPYRGGSHNLKQRLLRAEVLDNRCGVCGIQEWQGKPLSLHLDHINGHPSDNRLENLRLLCPNCHSQTPTYAGKAHRKPPNTCVDCETEIGRRYTRCRPCSAAFRAK